MRQGLIAGGDPLDQLAGLLHDGQVGGKVGIQHIVGAQGPQQGHHFPLDKGTLGHSEFLAQRRADGGRGADDDHLVRVLHGGADCRIFVDLGDAGGRADIGALAAVDADGLSAGLLQGVCTMYADLLCADLLAHAALDAQSFVPANAGVVLLNGDTN